MPYRTPRILLTLSLLIGVGLFGTVVPEQAAAAVTPRVAILVGPSAITDSNYHPSAQQIASTAAAAGAQVDLRYCPTPAEAKAAVNGANVVVYLGHGNGYPNPYSTTLLPDRTNGWGLRDPAKSWDGDSCTDTVLRYYGADYLTGKLEGDGWTGGAITPAPNFVMVYSNACYAPGAGESRPAPTQSVAVSRVAHYSRPILELGGTYFATDLGSRHLVDLILRGPEVAFGDLFRAAPGYSSSALSQVAHPLRPEASVWVQKTDSPWLGEDYWFAFAGDPYRTPSGAHVLYGGLFMDIWGSAFRNEIVWLAESGITAGCGPLRFCPTGLVTREQMASFLARALRLPASSTDFFTDDDGSSHQADINRLAASGITGGCGDGRFCPKAAVTREQMASFLARALRLPASSTDFFTDDDGSRHEADINRMAASGVTGGCGPGRFCPSASITREQMAAFLHRGLGK